MSKARKTWSIIAAIVTGGIAIAVYALGGPIAEAGVRMN